MGGPRKRRRKDVEPQEELQGVSIKTQAAEETGEEGPPAKKQQTRRSLFVRSLAASTTTESLVAHFSQQFPIKHATAVIDRTTQCCRGYGFITFADSDDAARALEELDGSSLDGRKIKLETAEPRHRELDDTLPVEAAGGGKARSIQSAALLEGKAQREKERQEAFRPPKLIVRNLPWSVKKPDQLEALFRSYGKVKHVTIPQKKGELLAGFGFVVLRGKKNAAKAIEGVNGLELDGRTLAVDWAVDKDVWENHSHVKEGEAPSEVTNGNEVGEDSLGQTAEIDGGVTLKEEDEDDPDDSSKDEEDDTEDENNEASSHEQQVPEDFSATLFIRNLPFTSDDDSLRQHFSQFGSVRYARVVLDPNTERSRGTGFVRFVEPADAKECLRKAPASQIQGNTGDSTETPSLLRSEADDPSGLYTIDGRVLNVSKAVDKREAARLAEQGSKHRSSQDKDKRRLYLLSEGTITAFIQLDTKLSIFEIAMREASAKQRKKLIESNPSLHLSLTRLSVRNIPRSVTSKDLKALAREAVVGFAKDVKAEKRDRLSREELIRGGQAMVDAEKQRKLRGVGVVKQAKVVFEGKEGAKVSEKSGAGRSRGYGFIEYYSHRFALMGLRWLNGHAVSPNTENSDGGKKVDGERNERRKRLIVEFAIENAQVVKRRGDREEQARKRSTTGFRYKSNPSSGENKLFETVPVVDGAGYDKERPSKTSKLTAGQNDKPKPGSVDAYKQVKQQRIINQKRAQRRERRRASKAS